MKKACLIIIICSILGVLVPKRYAQAHFLQISGSVGAVLHIDPDDDPIAKENSSFSLEFKNANEKFIAQECNCFISITEIGDPQSHPIIIDQKNIGYIRKNILIFKYTFPKKGVYRIKITPFNLTYDIRVERESIAEETKAPSHSLHYILFGGAILATVVVVIRDKSKALNV